MLGVKFKKNRRMNFAIMADIQMTLADIRNKTALQKR